MRIDAHHHFWQYSESEYGWIPDKMSLLRRDFLVADLQEVCAPAGVAGVVSVQVRQTIEENHFLLELAAESPLILGVVGWAPLADKGVGAILERFAANPKFRGVRHILQDEPADELMEAPAFRRGVASLASHRLAYDLLIYERHLARAIDFVDHAGDTTIILDHVAKPRIGEGVMEPWAKHLTELASRPNVYCKLSGMVTEADWADWTPAQVEPYIMHALEAFGPGRLMFGSDWPVMLVASSYARWVDLVQSVVCQLSDTERDRIWAGTAREAYGL